MAPSTRTPSKKQIEVLAALLHLQHLDGVDEPVGYGTPDVLSTVREYSHAEASTVNVINALNACVRHEWVTVRVDRGVQTTGRGDDLVWSLQAAGTEAFRRAPSSPVNPEEGTMHTTTQEPPTGTAPWGEGKAPLEDPQAAADAAALGELDGGEEDVNPDDVSVEDPDGDDASQPAVNEGSNQLSLAIGGPKPKSSILKIMAKQQKYGTTRQFKNMERIPFSGVLEVRGNAIDVQANGFTQRMAKAVIAELVIDGQDVSDNDE